MAVNRAVLIGLVVVAVLLGWRLYEQKHADTGQLGIRQNGGVVVLTWTGRVELPMHTLLMRAFDEWRNKSQHFLLRLNSPGGSLREGGDVVEPVSYTHLTLPTIVRECRSRWSG